MKKVLFALIAVLIVGTASAQEFSIGPRLGVSRGNVAVDGNGFSSGSSQLGYHAGVFARLGGNFIYLQPELLYTNTGGEIHETQGASSVSYQASFNRMDLPVLVGLKVANFFRIQAGPVASFMLNSELKDNLDNVIDPEYNSSTIGYQAGIGLDIANIILDLKYEAPFGNHAKSIGEFQTDQRQNQLILSLGIRLF